MRFLGIFSKNREEWAITDFASIISGITSVPLYDTLGQDAIEYILDQTQLKTIVCSAEKVKTIVDLKAAGKIKNIAQILYFDEIKSTDSDLAKSHGINLIKF